MSGTTLKKLITEDYGIKGHDRWFHAVDHDSLVLDYEKGIYYWNSVGLAGDALHYLMNIRNMSFESAKSFLKLEGHSDTVILTYQPNKEDIIIYPKLIDVFFENGQENERGREYWYTRKLTDNTIDRFKLGYHDSWYIIPIMEQGSLRQFQQRRDLPKKETRRWYKGVGPLLFNSDILSITDIVFIVEGPNDVLALSQQNIPAVCGDTGADTWLNDWFYRFIRQKLIYLCYDNDSAGDFGSKKTAKMLGETRCKIYNFWGFEKGYSPAYFFRDGGTKAEFMNIVETKSKYVFEMEKKKNESRR